MKIFLVALAVFVISTSTVVDGHDQHVRGIRRMAEDATSYNEVLIDHSAFGLAEPISTTSTSSSSSSDATRCGTPSMTAAGQEASALALDIFRFKRARAQEELENGGGSGGPQANFARTPKVIPVCFHVLGKRIGKRKLNKDLEALNKAFSASSCCDSSQSWCKGACSTDTKIRFVMARSLFGHLIKGTANKPSSLLACVNRQRKGVDMDNSDNALAVKEKMHAGDMRLLNVYFSDLSTNLGYSFFPQEIVANVNGTWDGVVISRKARYGGEEARFNESDTLVHEVGHWLGLEHTYANGCSPGDYVADTAPEATAYTGCDPATAPDTCSDSVADPIYNFMDSSDDICRYTWTSGQIDVMHANIEYYRSENKPNLQPVILINNVWSDKYSLAKGLMRLFYLDVSTSATITCTTKATGGDIDLFIRWNNVGLDTFDCESKLDGSAESCATPSASTGRLYAWVYSKASTIDFQVKCA